MVRGPASEEERREAVEAVEAERWTEGHAARRRRVARQIEELGGGGGGGVTWMEAAAVLLTRWRRGGLASTTVKSYMETLRGLARDEGAEKEVAAAWAVVRRGDAATRVAPTTSASAWEVAATLRRAPRTEAAAAVTAAWAAGGARYQTVRQLRVGDISLQEGGGVRICLRAEKKAKGRRRVFDV